MPVADVLMPTGNRTDLRQFGHDRVVVGQKQYRLFSQKLLQDGAHLRVLHPLCEEGISVVDLTKTPGGLGTTLFLQILLFTLYGFDHLVKMFGSQLPNVVAHLRVCKAAQEQKTITVKLVDLCLCQLHFTPPLYVMALF